MEWWRNRQSTKEAEKYKERMYEMAQKPEWTLEDMRSELDEAVNSWMAKVPGLNSNKETQMAKKLHQVMTGLASVVGPDATLDRLERMTELEKLRAAAAGNTNVKEVDTLIEQFGSTSIMHKILRHRQETGKPLPQTPESSQAIMQTEGRKYLSPTQKKKFIKTTQEAFMGGSSSSKKQRRRR